MTYVWSPASGTSGFAAKSLLTDVILASAAARNIAVTRINAKVYVLKHEQKSAVFFEHMPDSTSFVARKISRSKNIAKQFLERAGVCTPAGKVFGRADRTAAWDYARSIGMPVVVKPIIGSGGKGVTANISDFDHFTLAWQELTGTGSVIVEKHFSGTDFRLLVVGQRLVCALRRNPASLVGDGVHTIAELVEAKNQARQANLYAGRTFLKLTPVMLRTLATLGMTESSVPDAGQHLVLHHVCNLGLGGDTEDVSDIVHPGFAEIAVQACKAIPGAFHAGIDLLAADISKPPEEQTYTICEVNTRPDIALHHFPIFGTPRDAAGALLEGLFPAASLTPRDRWVRQHLTLSGKSIGGMGRYLHWQATLAGAAGWVRRTDKRTVEAVLCGPPRPVAKLVAALSRKPDIAAVVQDWAGPVPDGFTVKGGRVRAGAGKPGSVNRGAGSKAAGDRGHGEADQLDQIHRGIGRPDRVDLDAAVGE